jgi:hypothetical protein
VEPLEKPALPDADAITKSALRHTFHLGSEVKWGTPTISNLSCLLSEQEDRVLLWILCKLQPVRWRNAVRTLRRACHGVGDFHSTFEQVNQGSWSVFRILELVAKRDSSAAMIANFGVACIKVRPLICRRDCTNMFVRECMYVCMYVCMHADERPGTKYQNLFEAQPLPQRPRTWVGRGDD